MEQRRDTAWRAFAEAASASALSRHQKQEHPLVTAEHAEALISSGLASLAADTAVQASASALGPSIDAAEGAIRSAVASISRAASLAPVDEVGVDDDDEARQEAENEAKVTANAAAAALSALAESARMAKQSLRGLLAPLLLFTRGTRGRRFPGGSAPLRRALISLKRPSSGAPRTRTLFEF